VPVASRLKIHLSRCSEEAVNAISDTKRVYRGPEEAMLITIQTVSAHVRLIWNCRCPTCLPEIALMLNESEKTTAARGSDESEHPNLVRPTSTLRY